MTNSFNTPALFHHLICVEGQLFRDQEFDGYVDVSKPVASVEKSIAAGLNGFRVVPSLNLAHKSVLLRKINHLMKHLVHFIDERFLRFKIVLQNANLSIVFRRCFSWHVELPRIVL